MLLGYPVRSHLEADEDAQPPHDAPDMSPPGRNLPRSPVRHPSVLPRPLGATNRPRPARPSSCRLNATAAPGTPGQLHGSAPSGRPVQLTPAHNRTTSSHSYRPPRSGSPPPSGFRPTGTHLICVPSSRQSGFHPTVPIPTLSTGPARLDHAERKCMAPVDSVSASPTVDHNHHTPARPAHVRTHVDTPDALHRTSSDHGMHMGFPCGHMQ